MGQAKLRGTFEERKAQAIAAGRIKKKFSRPAFRQELFMKVLFNRLFSKKTANIPDVCQS